MKFTDEDPLKERKYMDIRQLNDSYAEIGMELINTEPQLQHIKNSNVTICYLGSEHEKKENGKLIYGQCEKVPEKYKWAIPCDFTVTIFEPNVERFSEEQLRILILHELMHIGIEHDGNEEKYNIRPHDVEDFRSLIDRFGIDWSET